jgi:hypothetical protein
MTNRKPFPILSALRKEGDTATLQYLRLWWADYREGPPQVAANDNDPDTKPIERETYRYELSAEELIAAYEAGTYAAALHSETRKPQVRRIKKPMPLPPDVDAEDENAKHIDTVKMRSWLGGDAIILDMAIGPYTYIDVGRHIGVDGSAKTAYRAGRQEVKDVAKTFHDEAA